MKNITLIIALLFVGVTATAKTTKATIAPYNYGESFIFVEGGVEFAVYPNGEFDFYYNPRFSNTSLRQIPHPGNNISYNAGYNYDAFVQYDDYGAVIQIEQVPVYYDFYGRIIQAGDVIIRYDHKGRIARIGGMNIRYNRFNQPVRYVGFINHYNTRYVFRPWHNYYMRPHANYRVVYYEPYRAYYEPVRMDYFYYYNNYYQTNNNYYSKNNFYRPGQQVASYNHGRRTTSERELKPVLRSSENVTRTPAPNSTATVRSNGEISRSEINSSSLYENNRGRERANIEQHEAAVRAQRGRSLLNEESVQNRSSENNISRRGSINSTVQNAERVRENHTPINRVNATQSRAVERPAAVTRGSQNSTVRSSVPERAAVQNTQNDTSRRNIRTQASTSGSSEVRQQRTPREALPSTRGSRGNE